jgi:hypothetical protein
MNPTPSTPEKASSAPAEAKKTHPKPQKAKKPMAKKAAPKKPVAKAGINKSEEIRKVAKELQAKGEKVRPVTIVEILKKRGIKIAPPQASMVLKKAGFKRRKRRVAGGASATGPLVKKTGKALSVDDLMKAKRAVEAFGGNAAKLVDAVSALVELQ